MCAFRCIYSFKLCVANYLIKSTDQEILHFFNYRVFIKFCVFSKEFRIFRTLVFLCFPSVSVCVHILGRENTSDAAELAEFRKSQHLKEKTQYLMNIL